MKLKLLFPLFLLLLLIALPSLTAIGLSGNKLGTIAYHPGTTIVNHYIVSGTSESLDISLDPGPFKEIYIDNLKGNEFDLVINFPEDEKPPTGSYSISLTVREVSDTTDASIGSLTSASKMFNIVVYSYEKVIDTNFYAPSVNEGTPVQFQLHVNSMTYQDIDVVKGIIKVYDREKRMLEEMFTDEQPLPSLNSATLSALFETKGLPANEYSATALVYYDGKEKEVETTFKIGEMDLLLENYTQFLTPGFNEFFIEVNNNWGDELRHVYAKIFLNEEEILQTSSITLEPWHKGILTGIAKIDLLPGTYPGMMQLFFEGEMKEEQISIIIEESVSKGNYLIILLVIIIILMVVLISVLIFFFLQKKKPKKKKIAQPEIEEKNEQKK